MRLKTSLNAPEWIDRGTVQPIIGYGQLRHELTMQLRIGWVCVLMVSHCDSGALKIILLQVVPAQWTGKICGRTEMLAERKHKVGLVPLHRQFRRPYDRCRNAELLEPEQQLAMTEFGKPFGRPVV